MVTKYHNYIQSYILIAYFGSFRLTSLVLNSVQTFDKTKYPLLGGCHVGPCAKNMQTSGDYQVVQLTKLSNHIICPATALKQLISKFKYEIHL